MQACESSNLRSFGYERSTQTLVVVFNSGGFWAFDEVEPERWAGLVVAESKGRYFRHEIQPWRRGRPISPHMIEQPGDES